MGRIVESFEGFNLNSEDNKEDLFLPNAYDYKNSSHELKKGEIFLGNIKISGQYDDMGEYTKKRNSFNTIRMGEQAYSITGEPLPRNEHRPIFIHKREEGEYDRYQNAKIRDIRMGYYNK